MRAGSSTGARSAARCPKYCSFQPICRLERALGAVGEQNGNGDGGEG